MCIMESFFQVLCQGHAELQCTAEENETQTDKRLEHVLEESCEICKEVHEECLAFQAALVKSVDALE